MKSKLLFLVLLLVIAGGGFVAWMQIEEKRLAVEELTQKNTQLTQELETMKQQIAAADLAKNQAAAQLQEVQKANCKGIWSDELGCQEPPQAFTSPLGGETLCFGKTVEVKWDSGQVQAESVNVMLATSSNSGKLATLPNLDGAYDWKLESPHKPIGGGDPFTIAAGMYRLRLQSPEGNLLSKDTELFTIKKCGAEKAAKASLPTKKAAPAKKKR